METEVLVAIIGGFVSIVVTIVTGFFGVLKQLKNVTLELSPNGGLSVKDQVTSLERKHDRIEERIDSIYEQMMRGSE